MPTIERNDMIRAVLASCEELEPGLDREFLEAIVNAWADAAGDVDAGVRATKAAVNAAIERGVGHVNVVVKPTADDNESGEEIR